MSEPVRDAAMRYADAWGRRSPADLAAVLAPDATLWNPRMGQLPRERIVHHLERLLEAFPDLAFAIEGTVLVEGNVAAYRWVMTGTNTGHLYGNAPTGNPVRLHGADFTEVSPEGLILRVIEYSDSAVFAAQLAGG